MPPIMGATAVVMAEILSISYTQVVTAALLPALLYYLALFMQVDLEAAKVGHRGLPRDQLPRLGAVLRKGWVFIVPLAVLVTCLFVLYLSPSKSALLATLTLLGVAAFSARNRLSWKELFESLAGTGQLVIELGIIGAVAGLIVGVIALTGLGLQFSQTLIAVSGGNTFLLLLLTALASIVLGMGMPVTASYIILAVLAAPALVMTGVSPIAAHLFIFYFALLSFITPPVCVAVYIASTVANSKPMETAAQAMKLGFVAFLVPFMFVADEALLLFGTLYEIGIALLSAILGVAALAVVFQGYWRRPLTWVTRLTLCGGGLLLISSLWQYRLAGLVVVLGVLAWLVRDSRAARAGVPPAGAVSAVLARDPDTPVRDPRRDA
jgi:TRAP transporter 4TM/12TM fusion protein